MSVTPPPPGGGSEVPGILTFEPPADRLDNQEQMETLPDPNAVSQGLNCENGAVELTESERARLGRVIVDGLLCNIIKANSRSPNEQELVAAIGRCISEAEIKESWWKLFNYYSEACDETRKVKVKD